MTENETENLEEADVEAMSGPEANGNGDSAGDDREIEKALKDLAARMTVLQSNVESVKDARGDLEGKLEEMESRMHRLGGLAEAVSSQYNPFLADNEPGEPSWEGARADQDEPMTPVAPADEPSPAGPEETNAPEAPGGETVGAAADEDVQADVPQPESVEAPPDAAASTPPEEAPSTPDEEPGTSQASVDEARPDELEEAKALSLDVRDVAQRQERARQRSSGDLRERLLLLEWVGLMMRRVGRAGLMDLMEYYEGLGWLDPGTKNRALRVAVGIDAPDRVDEGGWRGDLDLHERSLMAIQRLQGEDVTQAELEELQMDMRRLFER